MAVYLTMKKNVNADMTMDSFHEALAGSPAYKNSEIAIVEETDDSFTLCIGENNDKNICASVTGMVRTA